MSSELLIRSDELSTQTHDIQQMEAELQHTHTNLQHETTKSHDLTHELRAVNQVFIFFIIHKR